MFKDLSHILAPKGRKELSKNGLFNCLRTLTFVRYASLSQLHTLPGSWPKHIATGVFFDILIEYKYIGKANDEYYHVTYKTVKELELYHFIRGNDLRHRATEIEPHQRLLTDILLRKIYEPDFYTVFYPTFTKDDRVYLIPDAGIFYKRGEQYKLTFIEVERTEKPDQYLIDKNVKYREIASQFSTYNFLKGWIETVGLKPVPPEQFCFSIECHGNLKFEWEGWEWVSI